MWFSALVVLINLNNFGYRFFELRFICIYWRKNTPYEVFFCRINRGCVFFTFLKTLIRVLTHFTLFVILWGFSLERIKCLKSVETVTDWSLRKTWQFLSIWRSAWLQATNFKTRENTLRPWGWGSYLPSIYLLNPKPWRIVNLHFTFVKWICYWESLLNNSCALSRKRWVAWLAYKNDLRVRYFDRVSVNFKKKKKRREVLKR